MEPYWIGFGDIHDHVGMAERIPGVREAAGVIVSGDLTTGGGAREAARVLTAIKRLNPVVYAQIGNMDYAEVDRYLDQEAVNIHGRGLVLHEAEGAPLVGLMGVGCSTPTPFGTPCEHPESRLEAWLEAAYAPVRDCPHLLLVAHDPPRGTACDVVGGGRHVGSQAVRAFVERVGPAVCLSGHIHESRAKDTLGPTTVLNPGPLASGGYALIRLTDAGLVAELGQA